MTLTLEDLAVPKGAYDLSTVLEHWAWRVDESFSPLLPTALGNVFLERTDRSIWLLDTWSGELHRVCDTYETFRLAITQDQEFLRHWFLSDVNAEILETGIQRMADQCFSPFVSPSLGGTIAPENFSAISLNAQLATMAAECRALRGPHA